jgi:hypothetical protein
MAISNLVSSSQQRSSKDPATNAPIRKSNANANLTKKSNMFGDTFITNSITSMNSLGSQLNTLHDLSKKLVVSINILIKDIKVTQKDILSKFKSFNAELNANRIDFTKNAFTSAPTLDIPAIEDIGTPTLVAKNDKPASKDGPSDIAGMVKDALIDILGGRMALTTLGLLTGPLGAALLAFAGGSLVLYKSLEALTKAIMNEEDFKRALERDYGKSDPELMQENANRVREKNNPAGRAERSAARSGTFDNNSWGDDGKPITPGDVGGKFKDENGNEIWTLKKPLNDGTKYINSITGEKYLSADWNKGKLKTSPTPPPVTKPGAGAAPAQMAPAAPAPVLTSTSDSDTTTPVQRSRQNRLKGSAAPSADRPAKGAKPTEGAPMKAGGEGPQGDGAAAPAGGGDIGEKVVSTLAGTAGGILTSGFGPFAASLGAMAASSGASAAYVYVRDKLFPPPPKPTSPARRRGQTPRETSPDKGRGMTPPDEGDGLPNVNAPGVPDMFKTTPMLPNVNAPGVPDMFKTTPIMPNVNAPGVPEMFKVGDGDYHEGISRNPVTGEKLKGTGTSIFRQRARGQLMGNAGRENKAGFERIQFGAGGEDYGARNQTTWGDKDIGGMKTSVPIYYNPVTDKLFSPEAVIKSSERTRPEMLRGRMEQFDRQQATAAMQSAENSRVRSSVKPLQPIVMNNSSSTNNGSVAGSEADNMSGQNFPMNANNPNLQKIIAQQNVHYQ